MGSFILIVIIIRVVFVAQTSAGMPKKSPLPLPPFPLSPLPHFPLPALDAPFPAALYAASLWSGGPGVSPREILKLQIAVGEF